MIDKQGGVITHICGGLGNQMFQHSCGRAFALRHGANFQWDVTWYTCMAGCTPRTFMLPFFPALHMGGASAVPTARQTCIAALKTTHQSLVSKVWRRLLQRPVPCTPTYITEPHAHYWKGLLSVSPPAYLEGYWQDERYFADYAQDIVTDFAFPPFLAETSGIAKSIQSAECAVSVHVRRGDYAHSLVANKLHGTCSAVYYAESLEVIKSACPRAHLYLFSDDPKWVREHFVTHGLPCTVVDSQPEADAHHDMHLMTLCKHHVIANSSFSWWGAWLSGGFGLTIAPKTWFADKTMQQQNPCPERWVQI